MTCLNSQIKVNIELSAIGRDTLLALLQDVALTKTKIASTSNSPKEREECKHHGDIANSLYKIIYNQKKREYELNGGF